MKEIKGTSNRILEIDLSSRRVKEFEITLEERKKFLGGKGLGIHYLSRRIKPGDDPLGPGTPLIFLMGVLMGTGAPCSGRFAAVTRSPLTGIAATSSCGGPFGMACKTAGYDGLIITGKAASPIYLVIHEGGVEFEDASHLWGKDTVAAQEALEPGKKDGALVIGPAGENRVLYANIVSGHRYLGRGGFGAVMGAKNLKAVVARGGIYKIMPRDPDTFTKTRKTIVDRINSNNFTAIEYRKYGTPANVKFCRRGGILPVENFSRGDHERAMEVSGETMSEKYHTRPSTCIPCNILCGHKGTHADGSSHHIPEYETTALLGPNLGIFDTGLITRWNDLCNRLGMDTISTGTTLSYVMEAGEKGLMDTPLRFGSPAGIDQALEDIAYRRGLGDDMATGTLRLAQKYGGEEFALNVKGLEFPGYDPRGAFGQGLSYAVANRGACHLSSAVFAMEVFLGFLDPYSTRAKARVVHFLEALYAALNSLHICQFTAYAVTLEGWVVKYTPNPLVRFVMQNTPVAALGLIDTGPFSRLYQSITGIKVSPKELMEAGHRIHILERWLNTRLGISRKDDTLPGRFLREGRLEDSKKRTVPLDRMLDKYYRLRGYDRDGIPTPKTLEKYGLDTNFLPF